MFPANPFLRVHSRGVEWDVCRTRRALCPPTKLPLSEEQLLSNYQAGFLERTEFHVTPLWIEKVKVTLGDGTIASKAIIHGDCSYLFCYQKSNLATLVCWALKKSIKGFFLDDLNQVNVNLNLTWKLFATDVMQVFSQASGLLKLVPKYNVPKYNVPKYNVPTFTMPHCEKASGNKCNVHTTSSRVRQCTRFGTKCTQI